MMTQMNCVCFKWLIEVYWQPVFQLGFRAVYLYMSGCVCCITLSSNSSISCSVNAGGFNLEYFNCKRSPTSSMMPIACNRSILVLQTTSLQLKILTEFGKVVHLKLRLSANGWGIKTSNLNKEVSQGIWNKPLFYFEMYSEHLFKTIKARWLLFLPTPLLDTVMIPSFQTDRPGQTV